MSDRRIGKQLVAAGIGAIVLAVLVMTFESLKSPSHFATEQQHATDNRNTSQNLANEVVRDIPEGTDPHEVSAGTIPDPLPAIPDPKGAETVSLEWICVTSGGEAVVGANLSCVVTWVDASEGLTVSQRRLDVLTDRLGMAATRVVRGSEVSLSVVDDVWYADVIRFVCDGPQRVRIVLYRATTVRLRGQFDDGTPVLGMGYLRLPRPPATPGSPVSPRKTGFSTSFALGPQGTAQIEKVPVEGPLECTIMPKPRLGYGTIHQIIEPHELASEMEILVVVAKTNSHGVLRVEFGDQAVAQGHTITLEQSPGLALVSVLPPNSKNWTSSALQSTRKYRITITGNTAWRSEWVTVDGGVETVLTASLQPSGSIRARILDDQGRPLSGASLRVATGRYGTYRNGVALILDRFTAAVSDEAGRVTLRGLPAGATPVEAEALGFEIALRDTMVVSTGDVDLGDISLKAASGTVAVKLTGMKANCEYVVDVSQPGGGSVVSPPLLAKNGVFEMTSLPLRKYMVAVYLKQGGAVVSEFVELTYDVPAASLTIDVSRLSP